MFVLKPMHLFVRNLKRLKHRYRLMSFLYCGFEWVYVKLFILGHDPKVLKTPYLTEDLRLIFIYQIS